MSAPTVYFHIGAPKTGTTFLQDVMWRHREQLRADGLLYPGWRSDAHFLACLDLRRMKFLGYRPAAAAGSWARLVSEIRTWGGNAVLDHELFGAARPATIQRAVRDLHPAEVEIVYTVRDLARVLPAAWQERMKNRNMGSWGQFLEEVRAVDTRTPFWRLHNVPDVLARWAEVVGPERVHVITLPQSGRDPGALWRRYATTVGLDPERYDTSRVTSNESIGAAEAALLRDFNRSLADRAVPFRLYSFLIKERAAPLLARRNSARIGLPRDAYDWTVEWAHGEIAAIRAAGYDVIGDLDELLPAPYTPGVDPDTVELGPWTRRAAGAAAAAVRLVSPRRRDPSSAFGQGSQSDVAATTDDEGDESGHA